jgi:hypothetical protein
MPQPRLSLTARRGLARAHERATVAPLVRWSRLARQLSARIEPGEHVTIVGPTGAGKSTVLVELAEMFPDVVLVVTKRRDELLSGLRRRGWTVERDIGQLQRGPRMSFFERYFGEPAAPPMRVVFWPRPGSTIKATRKAQAEQVRALLDWAHNRGRVAIGIDEAMYAVEDLRLAAELRTLWHEGRASGISLLAASQRPSWLPKSAYSSPTYLAMFRTNDPDDLKRLADIGGAIDPKPLGRELRLLHRHEFLLVEPRLQPPRVTRTMVEL